MPTFYLDGTNGNDSWDGSSATFVSGSTGPKKTVTACANGAGIFTSDTTLIGVAGTTIYGDCTATTAPNSPFRTNSGVNLTMRATGSGAKPIFQFLKDASPNGHQARGFKMQGTGSFDAQDVELRGKGDSGSGVVSNTGGNLRLSNVVISSFFNCAQGGSGTVLIEDTTINQPGNNGILIDCDINANVGLNGIIRRTTIIAGSPTTNDPLVLHDGGIGIRSGWLLEDNVITAPSSGGNVESGMDVQQQFRGTTFRRNTVTNARQWSVAEGSLFSTKCPSTFSTKAAMLAYAFVREDTQSPYGINCGHCVWVTADGGNNGLWQLVGADTTQAASWNGPYTADDMLTAYNVYYQNTFSGNVAGIQIQHPGSQIVACNFIGITLGNWLINGGGTGGGTLIKLEAMGYGAKVWGCNFATSSGKYVDVQNGNMVTSTRPAVNIAPLRSEIASRNRIILKDNIIRQRSEHVGPFFNFQAVADHGQVTSDYNAYLSDTGVSDATWPNFSTSNGTNRTYTNFKSINGGSDAHSQWITPTTAVVSDAESKLSTGSPLIGAGVARSGLDAGIPAEDVLRVAISSPPDIGSYSYASPSAIAAVGQTLFSLLKTTKTAGSPPTIVTIPGLVTGFAATPGTGSFACTWNSTDGADFYEIRYALTGSVVFTTSDPATGTSATISGLSSATAYDLYIRAVNGAGAGLWSAVITRTTL